MDPSFVLRKSVLRAALLAVTVGCGGAVATGRADGGGTSDATVLPDDGASSSDARPGGDGGPPSRGSSLSCPSFGDASPVAAGRIPMNHRSAAAACTVPRAAVTPTACGCPDGGVDPIDEPDGSTCLCGSCAQDSDCKAGPNGRCGEKLTVPASLRCSYDECLTDSDCGGGVPCWCRPSSSTSFSNSCLTGSQCAVDSDCGPGGFCSPTLIVARCSCHNMTLCPDSGASCSDNNSLGCECRDSCGHGYYCHTPCDTCVDDSDCDNGGTCNYDLVEHRWQCQYCWPFP